MTIFPTTQTLVLTSLPDDMLMDYRCAVDEAREELAARKHAIDAEIERRLRERNARALLHPSFEKIELEEQWTAYAYDLDALRAAANILRESGKDGEAAKILKHVPEQVTVIAEHDEPGNPRSITALREKYGDTPVLGEHLQSAMTRQSLGTKLVVKAKAAKELQP